MKSENENLLFRTTRTHAGGERYFNCPPPPAAANAPARRGCLTQQAGAAAASGPAVRTQKAGILAVCEGACRIHKSPLTREQIIERYQAVFGRKLSVAAACGRINALCKDADSLSKNLPGLRVAGTAVSTAGVKVHTYKFVSAHMGGN